MNRLFFHGGWLAITLCLLLGTGRGFAADEPPKTSKATPEVMIKRKTVKQIEAATSKFFIARGYTKKTGPNEELIYEKPRNNESPDIKQCLRIRVRIGKPDNNTIKVMSRSFGVENCGTAKEKELPTPAAHPQIQGFLEAIKKSLDSK